MVLEELLFQLRQFGDGYPAGARRVIPPLHLRQPFIAEIEMEGHGHDTAACAAARVIERGLAAQRRPHARRQSLEAGFLLQLAQRCGIELLAWLDESARAGPEAIANLAAA